MGFNIKLLKKEDYKASSWSGGITTEFLIFPPEASYSDRNFKWRLSSAIVNTEVSTFTHLPNISRVLMVLEGELLLDHEGHHKRSLNAYEQDSFSGGWITKSYGMATDFNLMMAEDSEGKIELLSVKPKENIELSINNQKSSRFFNYIAEVYYCESGEVEVLIRENESFYLKQGELLSINGELNEDEVKLKFSNKGEKTANLIRCNIFFNIGGLK